ncbi:MAG TPA: hypothetical protein VEJ87_02940 [Acidimicrobiales bacterium]|nr:hypothetical protein [Acidimicrobiales bacterium]
MPGTITIIPWSDPVIESLGHDPRSIYVETFWLPVLGPSTTFLLRRVARSFDSDPEGFPMELEDTARALGVGGRSGRNAPFQRALGRCVTFGMARWVEHGTLGVRRKLPPLARRHLVRLPDPLRARHDQWLESLRVSKESLRVSKEVEELRQRARRLALNQLRLGRTIVATENELARHSIHPALAHESIDWAVFQQRRQTSADGEV